MKFKVGDKVKIVGKSLGRSFESLSYSDGEIVAICGSGDGSNGDNCIDVRPLGRMYPVDWYAPPDLILPLENQIEQMFDELIEDL